MRPAPGEVLHFSEDPSIEWFEPRVARTPRESRPFVWAVDADRAPAYWFPRECPRAMAWPLPSTSEPDRLLLGPAARVHLIEYGWLARVRSVRLWAYRLPAATFHPYGEPQQPHALVSERGVGPLAPPTRVPDLLDLHEQAGIELRLAPRIWPFVDLVQATSLHLSVVRGRNARRPGRGGFRASSAKRGGVGRPIPPAFADSARIHR